MIRKAKFLAKEAELRIRYFMEKDCIFCKIVSGKMKADVVLETDKILAFNDINPVSNVHVLIVPKKHIDSVLTVTDADGAGLVAMYGAVASNGKNRGLGAFRVAINGGKFQHVGHLHMHLLAGSKIEWRKL